MWAALSATPEVTEIDDDWERVVYLESINPTVTPQGFGRVKVTLSSHTVYTDPVGYDTATTTVTLAGDDLVITDSDGASENHYRFTSDGTSLIIDDAGTSGVHIIAIDGAVAGGSGDHSSSVTIPFSSWTGKLIVNSSGGDDSITFDPHFATGSRRDILLDGGAGTDILNWEATANVGAVNFDVDTILMSGGAVNTGGSEFSLTATGDITISSDVETDGGEINVFADNDGDGSGTLVLRQAEAGMWTTQSVETAGQVGLFTSLAVVDGKPAMSYFDVTNSDVKFAINASTDGNGVWTTTRVDTAGTFGQYTSLATVDGRPAIAFYEEFNGDLKFAINANADGSGTWTITTVDTANFTGKYASLAVIGGKPAISYYDDTFDDLKFAINANADGSGAWTVGNVETTGIVGLYTSLAEVDGRPAISYQRVLGGGLKFAINASADGGGAWTVSNVDTVGTVGKFTSLAVIGGKPAISYHSVTDNELRFAVNASADGGGSWTVTTVDTDGEVGTDTSLTDVNGLPAISYYDSANGDLKYAFNTAADGTGAWTVASVATVGNVGQYTSLAVVGGKPAISYYDISNGNLKFAKLNSPSAGTLSAGAGNQMLTAAAMSIGGAVSGTGTLALRPSRPAADIDLGFATGSGELVLEDDELGNLADGFSSILIGDAVNGTGTLTLDTAGFQDPVILVGGNIVDGDGTDLTLSTGATLDGDIQPGGPAAVGELNIDGALTVADDRAVTFEFSGAATAGTDYDALTVTGSVTLGGNVSAAFAGLGGFTPGGGEIFTLIRRTGGTGMFAGLPEGSALPNFLGSGLEAMIRYTGGDGDDVVVLVAPYPPEIAVGGNGVDIADGDIIPDLADHTDFGVVPVSGGMVVRTFTITNNGPGALSLTGTPLVGVDAGAFSLTSPPSSDTVAAGGGTRTFQITFNPAVGGLYTATVSIANDDADENPFTFGISGARTTPEEQFDATVAAAGLTGGDAAADAIPFDDGVANLLKYAFKMDLTGPDQRIQIPGGPAGGLPFMEYLAETSDGGPGFRFEFVRRIGSGLGYTPQKNTDLLDPPSWSPLADEPVVTPIDDDWERVVVETSVNLTITLRYFVRVAVSFLP